MLSPTVNRYGSFVISGNASKISSQLAAMMAKEQGRCPSIAHEGGRHENLMQTESVVVGAGLAPQNTQAPVLAEAV